MLRLARMGVIILPPVPAFYNHPKDIDDIVNHVVGRVLDQFEISVNVVKRWKGVMSVSGGEDLTTSEEKPDLEKAKWWWGPYPPN